MSGTDSPEQGSGNDTALSVEAGAAAIENLLSSVPDENQDSAANEESEHEGQEAVVDNAEQAPDEGEEGLEFDEEAPSGEETPAPEESAFKNGQFASRDARVKLDDGTTISVADLISGNMFQRTFTEKTTALANDRKALEQERGQYAETKQQVDHQRNVIMTLAQKLLPKEPSPPEDREDLVRYIEYQREKAEYDQTMGELDALWKASQGDLQHFQQQQQQEAEKQQKAFHDQWQSALVSEGEKLFSKMPALREQAGWDAFKKEAYDYGKKYWDVSPEEIDSLPDHRQLLILADAMKYRKAIEKRDAGKKPQPPAGQQSAQTPRVPQKQRMAPQSPQARDSNAAIDRLRKSGSINDAAKALERFV